MDDMISTIRMSDICVFIAQRISADDVLSTTFHKQGLQSILDESKPESERVTDNFEFEDIDADSRCNLFLEETIGKQPLTFPLYVKDDTGASWGWRYVKFSVNLAIHTRKNDPESAIKRIDLYRRVAEIALAAQNEFEGKRVWKLIG